MALPTPLTNFPEHSCCPSSVSSCHLDGEKTALVWLITMTRQFKKLLLLFLIEGAVGSTQLPTDINKHYLLRISFPSNLLDKTEIHSRLVSSHVTHHVFFFQIIFFFPFRSCFWRCIFSCNHKQIWKTQYKYKQHSSVSQSTHWGCRADERKNLGLSL